MTSSPTMAVSPITTPMPWSMKKRRPSVAPGWISTPVRNLANCESSRAGRHHSATQSRCVSRYAQIACRPEYARKTSTSLRAAGSCARAVARSSFRDRRSGTRSVKQIFVEHRRQVPLAVARDDDDDRLAGVLGPLGELDGRVHGRTRRDAAEDALLDAEAAGGGDGGGDVDVDDLVVHLAVQDRRHEVGTDALDLVRAGGAAVQDRRLLGLDAHDLHAGLALLEHLADARERATRADARDED